MKIGYGRVSTGDQHPEAQVTMRTSSPRMAGVRTAAAPALLAVIVALAGDGCTSATPSETTSATSTSTDQATSTAPSLSAKSTGTTSGSNSTGSASSSGPADSSNGSTVIDFAPTAGLPKSAEKSASGYHSTISPIDDATASRMASSWRPGCPVGLPDLRYMTVTYRGFDGADHTGELVVAASVARDVPDIFRDLYQAGFPIASMRLVDDFAGDDNASMAADNSSAFNCRPITGGGGFSKHSYGTAIDLNPVQNPYLSGTLVLPEAGRGYLDRKPAPGVITSGDAVVTAFAARGWTWGGTWSGPIDYQHFSVSGH